MIKIDYIECDNCGEKIAEDVYYVDGIIYSCCSITCLAHLMLNMRVTSPQKRYDNLN